MEVLGPLKNHLLHKGESQRLDLRQQRKWMELTLKKKQFHENNIRASEYLMDVKIIEFISFLISWIGKRN